MLIVDSREHWTHPRSRDYHIRGWLDKKKIPWEVRKLDVGDYMIDGGNVSVDRKADVEEISKNLLNPEDKKRFWREVRLAHHRRIKLVVLIETPKYTEIMDLRFWKSAYSPARGPAVIREMRRLQNSYGVEFVFCKRLQAAKKIMEILEANNGELHNK